MIETIKTPRVYWLVYTGQVYIVQCTEHRVSYTQHSTVLFRIKNKVNYQYVVRALYNSDAQALCTCSSRQEKWDLFIISLPHLYIRYTWICILAFKLYLTYISSQNTVNLVEFKTALNTSTNYHCPLYYISVDPLLL